MKRTEEEIIELFETNENITIYNIYLIGRSDAIIDVETILHKTKEATK